jgi:hypothetical protein
VERIENTVKRQTLNWKSGSHVPELCLRLEASGTTRRRRDGKFRFDSLKIVEKSPLSDVSSRTNSSHSLVLLPINPPQVRTTATSSQTFRRLTGPWAMSASDGSRSSVSIYREVSSRHLQSRHRQSFVLHFHERQSRQPESGDESDDECSP